MTRATGVTVTAVYTYNGDGLRVAQAVNGVETWFTWDQAAARPQVVATSGGQTAQYLYGRELLGVQQGGQGYSPLADALGSLRQWTDAAGAVVGSASYDPFGGVLSQPGFTSPWGFAGEYHDPLTGLQYLRARWYQPGVGRFTQVDPFQGIQTLPLTQNPYVYGLNSPTNFTDPTGKDPLLAALGYAGLAGLLAGGAELWAQTAYYMIDLGCTWAQTWHLLNWGQIAGVAFNAALATFEYIAFATLFPEALIARIVLGFAVGAATNVVGDFAGRAVEAFINHRLPQNNPFDFRTYRADILWGGVFASMGEIGGVFVQRAKIRAELKINAAQLLQNGAFEQVLYTDIGKKQASVLTRRYFYQSLLISESQRVVQQSDRALKVLNVGLNSTLWYILLTEE